MTVILRHAVRQQITTIVCEVYASQIFPALRPGCPLYTQPPNSTQLYHPTPDPSLPELQLPRVQYSSAFIRVHRSELGPLLGQHEGGRPAHVRAALRHWLRAEGPVAGRALLVLLDDDG